MNFLAQNRPVLFFSFRSPYAWILWEELNRRYPNFINRITWMPYWEPTSWLAGILKAKLIPFEYQKMSKAKSFYVLEDVKRRSRELGLNVKWPIDRDPVWEYSHFAYLDAVSRGLGSELLRDFFQARWLRGINLHDPAIIEEMARTLFGANVDRSRWLEGSDLTEQAVDAFRYAALQRLFGVPYLVDGHNHFFGVDSVIRRVAEAAPSFAGDAQMLSDFPAYDDDPAGGCG